MKQLSIVNWNIEWAKPNTKKGGIIKQKINEHTPDILCLTETYRDFLGEKGYSIFAHSDYGYRNSTGKHKVALWSKNKWENVSVMDNYNLPSGRIVSGTTQTSIGKLNVLGVCIPWKNAHVSTGYKNKKSWEEHLNYLRGLQKVLEHDVFRSDTIIIGDFNQEIPRKYSPSEAYNELLKTFESYNLITEGYIDGINKQTIDHIYCSNDMEGQNIFGINHIDNGLKLSDHFGISASLYKT